MKSSKILRFAGDVSLDKARIITSNGFFQDISAQIINIQYYEDLFSPFITGSIIIKESLDYINLFPFIGEEYIDLEITTPTLERSGIKGRYYIYKITDRELIGNRNVVYQMHFISPEAIVDLNKKISRVFGDKISNLVEPFIKDKTIGLESEKKVFIEPTNNSTKYISNFWSPFKNINYLTSLSTNANKSPSYIFFENRDGFYYCSLETLYVGNTYQKFVYDSYTRDSLPLSGSVKNIQEDYKRITEISIPNVFDYMKRISSGMLSSKQFTYDATKKTYSSKNYNMFQRFAEQKHLNKFAINSDRAIFRSNATIFNYPKNYGNFNGFGDVTGAKINQERISLLTLAEANKIDIVVPGRTDYTVGQKVDVSLPKIEPISQKDNDTVDKMFSGLYLIAAINHYIDKEKHECHMELIKESSLLDMNRGK